MESVVVPEITFKSVVQSHVVYEILLQKITAKLMDIPNLSTFKLSNHFTEVVCTLVEECVKKKQKVDKKKLVLAILTSLFGLTPPEQTIIGSQIEYLLEHDIIVRKVKPVVTRVYHKFQKLTIGKK